METAKAKTWIVAYDFSECAHHAAILGAEMLARQGGGRLLIVHAYPRDLRHALAAFDMDRDVPSIELDNAYLNDAQRQLEEDISDIHADPNVRVDARIVTGRPASAISRTAEETDATMILVGHKRHLDGRVMIGGVVDGIIRRATCAVMVVKNVSPA